MTKSSVSHFIDAKAIRLSGSAFNMALEISFHDPKFRTQVKKVMLTINYRRNIDMRPKMQIITAHPVWWHDESHHIYYHRTDMFLSGEDNGWDVTLIPLSVHRRSHTATGKWMTFIIKPYLSCFAAIEGCFSSNTPNSMNTSHAMPVIMLGINWINCNLQSKLINTIPLWNLPDACNIPPTIFHRFAMVKWILFRNSIVLCFVADLCLIRIARCVNWLKEGKGRSEMNGMLTFVFKIHFRRMLFPYNLKLWLSLQV